MKVSKLIIIGVFAVVSCHSVPGPTQTPRSPVGCENIVDVKLESIPFGKIEGRSARAWIEVNYPRAEFTTDTGRSIYWHHLGRGYVSFFDESSTDKSYVTYDLTLPPTIAEVIKCYGAPSSYFVGETKGADYPIVRFLMFYPNRGILVAHADKTPRKNLTSQSVRMNSIAIRRTNSIDLLARTEFSEEFAKIIAANIRPWPEDIADIRFE